MTTLTHRVTLTYREGGTTRHQVSDADVGLRRLATINPTAVGGHAVILDLERNGTSTLAELGWTSELVKPGDCPHPRLTVHNDHAAMDYQVACRNCRANWGWDDLHLPDHVRARAMPVWEQHGL